MSTSVTNVVSHFPSAQNGFTTTLASTISSGATTVPLNSVAGYTNGQTAVFVVDPADPTKKQTFTGIVDTSGVQITSVVWTAGTNVTHSGGATVVDYATATHISMVTKGILVNHGQTGAHKTLTDANGNEWLELGTTASAVNQVKVTNAATGNAPVISASGDDSNIGLTLTPKGTGSVNMTGRADGWVTGLPTPNTVTYNGNRNYSLVFNTTDLTGYISNGQRLRLTRTAAAPTQCTSLNGSTQYYSKTTPSGMTFTNNFVVSAWVKLSSYGATGTIASRYNGTSGWEVRVASDGRIQMLGYNASSSNNSYVISYASIPLNKWVHVAAQLDMATFTATPTTSYIMFDGLDVAAQVLRNGTNPTALVQAGNLEIGSSNGGANPFPGKLAQVAIYSAKVTQAIILASITQTLAGTETSLISAYSFNNVVTDLNANANTLTANGSAVATNVDSPFAGGANASTAYTAGTTEYGEVFDVTFSTNTTVVVQVPDGYAIPTSGGVSALAYSTHAQPLGWPGLGHILGRAILQNTWTTTTTPTIVDVDGLSVTCYVPAGRRVKLKFYIGRLVPPGTTTAITQSVREGSTYLTTAVVNTLGAGVGAESTVQDVIDTTKGSHTYKASVAENAAGTLTLAASTGGLLTNGPIYLQVELEPVV